MSACLAARINLVGAHVKLSLRTFDHAIAVTAAESEAYPSFERAFWGDILDSRAFGLFACHTDDRTEIVRARKMKRFCANGSPGVGPGRMYATRKMLARDVLANRVVSCAPSVTIVGSCARICEKAGNGLYHRCRVGKTVSDEVVNAFL